MSDNRNRPSREEAIKHYGVKGMKWGVRRTDAQLGQARRVTKVKKAQKVDENLGRGKRVRAARRSTLRTRAQMKEAERDVIRADTAKGKKEAIRIADEARAAHITNPNRATSRKITIGEGVAAVLLVPGVGLGAVAVASVGSVAAQRSARYQKSDYEARDN